MARSTSSTPLPGGLGTAGAALWRRLTGLTSDAGQAIEFSVHELVVLELACRQADNAAALEAILEADGMTVTGSKGQVRLSQVPTELRLQRASMARLIAALALPSGDEQVGLAPIVRRAQRAADARWARQAAARDGRANG